MKNLLILSKCIISISLLLPFCSCDKNEEEPLPEMYISIDGDIRQINDVGLTIIDLHKYSFHESYDEPAGIQFVLDIYDPDKIAIGDIGDFINNEIELYIDIYPVEAPPFQNTTVFPCYTEEDLWAYITSQERKEFRKGKARILLRLKTQDDDSIFGDEAQTGEEVHVEYKDGKYEVVLKDVTVRDLKLSARLIIH